MSQAIDPLFEQRPSYRREEPSQEPTTPGPASRDASSRAATIDAQHDFDYDANSDLLAQPFVRADQMTEDTPIFPGGPMWSQVLVWKKMAEENGHFIGITEFGGQRFIWRTINRVEYKEIVATPNTDPLMREEMICEMAVLWPRPFTTEQMAKGRAGLPTLLAQQIMLASGFDRAVSYRPLF